MFLQKDPQHGVLPAAEWRSTLYRRLHQCRAVIAICSPQYASSDWCVAEAAIAVAEGKLVFPIHFGEQHLPSLLQDRQAIAMEEAIALSADSEEDARKRLKRGLDEQLNWRDRLRWDPDPPNRSPFPGLDPFDETHAPVFHGRDQAIAKVQKRLLGLSRTGPQKPKGSGPDPPPTRRPERSEGQTTQPRQKSRLKKFKKILNFVRGFSKQKSQKCKKLNF